MANTTRLSDLPTSQENITYQVQPHAHTQPSTIVFPNQPDNLANIQISDSSNRGGGSGLTNSLQGSQSKYMPMNIHPNPYGNGIPSVDSIPSPESRPNGRVSGDGSVPPNLRLMSHEGMQVQNQESRIIPEILPTEMQRLPSRDIPKETIYYQQDAAVQANYIPPPDSKKRVTDYIKEYDDTEPDKIRKNTKTKKSQEWYENLFRAYQTPLIIALLYFIFQMKIITTLLFHYLGKWSWLYQTDGHMTVYGEILKSILFSTCYISFMTLITWI